MEEILHQLRLVVYPMKYSIATVDGSEILLTSWDWVDYLII